MKSRVIMLGLVLSLAGCTGSPGNHYYTLTPVVPDVKAAALPTGHNWLLSAVTIPDLLDRPQIVLKSGANGIVRLEYDRWAEPLESMAYRVLADDFTARTGLPSSMPGIPEHRIHIVINELEADENGNVTLAATWKTETANMTETHSFRRSEPADRHQISSIVSAMSHLLGTLTDTIISTR